ncbi:hypothetical protein B0H14DRAFT_2597388 [Mycena olivaceomarginata]|nr:hypothetical protein B0H14DRAFT_2597388 [Mycena olivaceomarginata]
MSTLTRTSGSLAGVPACIVVDGGREEAWSQKGRLSNLPNGGIGGMVLGKMMGGGRALPFASPKMPKATKPVKPRPRVVCAPVAVVTPTGGSKTVMKTYTPAQRNKLQDMTNLEMKAQMAAALKMRTPSTYEDVVQGNVHVEISHASGEMEALAADLNTTVNDKRTSHATCSQCDTIQREVLGFWAQMKAMTSAYIKWGASQDRQSMDMSSIQRAEILRTRNQ